MYITKRGILRFWLSEPEIDNTPVPAGYHRLDFRNPPFPDTRTLGPDERKAIRDLVAKHPEYLLLEIYCDHKIIQ